MNEHSFVQANGVQLYVEVAGASRNAPLLLVLHGGPGNVVLGMVPFQLNVGRQLEKDFLVAYLHQRGAGKSLPVPDAEQTIANHVDDVSSIVKYLAAKYHQARVHLVGHSWGGMLAVMYAGKHQQTVSKVVLISTAMNFKSLLRDSHDATLQWATKMGMPGAVADLSGIDRSFTTWKDFTTLSRWANQAEGGVVGRFDMAEFVKANAIDKDYPNYMTQLSTIARALSQELLDIDLDDVISTLDIPALFVSGGRDTIITERSMRRDYGSYGGEKEFVFLADSHHLPFIDQPDELSREIRQFLAK